MILLFKIISRWPLWWVRGLGLALGWLVWAISPRYRRMMDQNLRQALVSGQIPIPAASPDSRKLLRESIGHAGLIAAELPKIWCDSGLDSMTKVSGLSGVHEVLDQGRGVILLTPHLGAFELAPRVFARHRPITVLYRPARQRMFRRLMESLRPMGNLYTAPANAAGVRQLLRALRRAETIGMLPDQVPGQGEGVWTPFFGRPAFTMTLPIRLAQISGAAIFWVLAVRTAGGWRLDFAPWKMSADIAGLPLGAAVAEMNLELGRQIARAPEQYLWAYNRYKLPRNSQAPEEISQT